MRRSTLHAAFLVAVAMTISSATARAQTGDRYPALLRGAVDYASSIASLIAGGDAVYLFTITDEGGAGDGFTLDSGASRAWGYWFYSPARDSAYGVAVASQAGSVFATIQTSVYGLSEAPVPLDTSGAYVASATFADSIRNDAAYQAFLEEHPELTGLFVQLAMPGDTWMQPLPIGFPTDDATWIAVSPRFGDSINVCFLSTETGMFECVTQFYRGIVYNIDLSTTSSVEFGVTNFGVFGGNYATQSASFEAPAGSGNEYIFGAGLWFGARKRVAGALTSRVFITYDPNSGASWASPGEGYVDRESFSVPELFGSYEFDRQTGEPFDGEINWPLWLGTSDPEASLMSPGTFVPLNGDRVVGGALIAPSFVPEVAVQYISRYHDANVASYFNNTDAVGFPLGLQFQENVFSEPGGFDHTVIVSYEIVNRSSDTLFEAVAGVVTDFDLGNAANDRTRFYGQRPELRSAVAWTANEPGGLPYGVLVMTLLEAPVTDGQGYIASGNRDQFMSQGEVGTYQGWTIETDPAGSLARYSFMTSGDKDGDAGAGDYRGLLASETFTMLPGDTAHVAVAYVVNRDRASTTGADPALEARIQNVINAYYGLEFSSVRTSVSASGGLTLAAAPNPARDVVALRVKLDRASEATLEVFDHLGSRVIDRELGQLGAGETVRTMDVGGLSSGTYLVVVRAGEARVSIPLVVTH